MPYKELFTTVVLEQVLVAAATSCFRVCSSCHSCYGRIQLQKQRIQLQNRRIQLQTRRIQLQNRQIQLQMGRIQLQSRRIQLQKPAIKSFILCVFPWHLLMNTGYL